eukprot:768468-Hanusia_phi.AAC.3
MKPSFLRCLQYAPDGEGDEKGGEEGEGEGGEEGEGEGGEEGEVEGEERRKMSTEVQGRGRSKSSKSASRYASSIDTIQQLLVPRRVPLPVIEMIVISARKLRHRQPDRDLDGITSARPRSLLQSHLLVFSPNDFITNFVVVAISVHGLHAALPGSVELLQGKLQLSFLS